VANKAVFRNCLVSMRPSALKADLPSRNDIVTYTHNEFISFFSNLKTRINVVHFCDRQQTTRTDLYLITQAETTGRVSVTTDLWSVSQTKASFMGITAHWIESNPKTSKWTLCSEVIAFRAIFGRHDGHNLGRYFIGLCERAGLIDRKASRVRRSNTWSYRM
jgi:hypothetical protein